ncbi:MAG: ParB/RepB/Spo0J family partition protein [Bacilli bacterium]|nr:ParB/RepB/Spo0J family partition protein [Bacilli bacterium]
MYPDSKDEVVQLYLDDIIPNRFQPREIFDERALKELAVSIKEHGVIQPIIVRNVNGKYEIIAGERRYKASALAGLTKIPAIIRDLDDKESSKVALLENLQRKNLNPIEEARTYQKILELDEMTQEELAKTMGKSQSAVANKIRLLSLPEEVQTALLKEQISERHARTLLNIPDEKSQKEMLKKVIDNKISVRNLEEEIKEKYGTKKSNEEESLPEIKIASTDAFVNDQPLIPTAELPKDESNFGKVRIAPPEGEDMPQGNFLNFNMPEEDDEKMKSSLIDLTPIKSMDDKKQENNAPEVSKDADLDSLLSLGNPTSSTPSTNYITPAEKIVKQDPNLYLKKDIQSDYFDASEVSAIHIPLADMMQPDDNEENNNKDSIDDIDLNDDKLNITFADEEKTKEEKEEEENQEENEKFTLEEATDKIRSLVGEIQSKGLNINIDEMNFDKTYQFIIKIQKDNE